jgi:hypothetical protein
MALMISSYYDNGGIICWVNKTMLSKTTTFTALSSAYFQNTKTPKHQNTKTPKHQNTTSLAAWLCQMWHISALFRVVYYSV